MKNTLSSSSNRIDYSITSEQLIKIREDVNVLREALNFLRPFSREDLEGIYRLSDADRALLRDYHNEMSNNANILPPFIDAEAFQRDLDTGERLAQLEDWVRDLLGLIERNRAIAFAEAYATGSVFYRFLMAAGKSGILEASQSYDRINTVHTNRKSGGRTASKAARRNQNPG